MWKKLFYSKGVPKLRKKVVTTLEKGFFNDEKKVVFGKRREKLVVFDGKKKRKFQ